MNKASPPTRERVSVTIVDASGLLANAALEHVRHRADAKIFVWLDICGQPAAAAEYLRLFGLPERDIAWALNFGQAGRISLERNNVLRAVTWLAEPGLRLVEVHVRSSPAGILTVWNGDPALLDGIRQHFAERVAGFNSHPFHAVGVLLELLLSTVDQGVGGLDEAIDQRYQQVQHRPDSVDIGELSRMLETVRAIWLRHDRYASAARSATVGIEAVPGMSAQSARELNEYVEHIEDVEHRLRERYQWASGVLQDYSAVLARRQGEQINRLTVVSIIFLPITFLTGFFGMNFDYLQQLIGGKAAFVGFGLALPLATFAATAGWLRRRGLL